MADIELKNADEFLKELHKQNQPKKQLTDKQKIANLRKENKALKNDVKAMKEQYNKLLDEYKELLKLAQQQDNIIKQYKNRGNN